MPAIVDKIIIKDPFLDRRIKLLFCQREMVHFWFQKGLSITAISKLFKVNKRLIQFELFPERKEKNLQQRAERGGTKLYYDKEYHICKTREHRQYKHKLFIEK